MVVPGSTVSGLRFSVVRKERGGMDVRWGRPDLVKSTIVRIVDGRIESRYSKRTSEGLGDHFNRRPR